MVKQSFLRTWFYLPKVNFKKRIEWLGRIFFWKVVCDHHIGRQPWSKSIFFCSGQCIPRGQGTGNSFEVGSIISRALGSMQACFSSSLLLVFSCGNCSISESGFFLPFQDHLSTVGIFFHLFFSVRFQAYVCGALHIVDFKHYLIYSASPLLLC